MPELPLEFVEQMKTSLGTDYPRFEAALNRPAPVSIRYNPSKLAVDFPPSGEKIPWTEYGYYLQERPKFTYDPLFHGGMYYVQEASSMLVEAAFRQTMPSADGIKVLDMCAAPGGKSTLLASLLGNGSLLVANEVIKSRYHILRENLSKWGWPNIVSTSSKPESLGGLEGLFDFVLVDAPCSGEGLFRKMPAACDHWSPENVALCANRQQSILEHATRCVKPGGILVFSTCTYNELENDGSANFIIERGNFGKVDIETTHFPGLTPTRLGYQCYPHKVEGEGFYMAVFRKENQSFPGKGKKKKKGGKSLKTFKKENIKNVLPFLQKQGAELTFFQGREDEIRAIPTNIFDGVPQLMNQLPFIEAGVSLGLLKNRKFIPSHELAISNLIANEFPCVQLSTPEAIKYLKRENIHNNEWPKGWTLVHHQHLNLGWIKPLGNRSNNYYPKEWRIRN